MKKENISKIHSMKESTSFLSLFSPRNATFIKVCENSKELCKHRAWKSCANTARGRVFALLHFRFLKHPLVFNF